MCSIQHYLNCQVLIRVSQVLLLNFNYNQYNVAKDIKTNTAQFIAIKYSDDHKLYKDENSKAVAQSL